MRNRLFFFRSSAPSSGNNNAIPQPATEKQVYWENPFESGLNSGNTKNSNRSLKGLISKARKLTCNFILSRCQSFSKNSYSQKNHAGNGNGSERLSQSHVLHKTRSTDYDPVIPISIEEERLRERVWELSEQNVSLQREVSSFHEREAESRKFELKAETLLTNLLFEKLYSMGSKVEQLQAELAAAVRGNDILRAEVQNTQDDLSYATHKLKDLKLQVILSCHL